MYAKRFSPSSLILFISFSAISFLLVFSCGTLSKLSNNNLAHLYGKELLDLRPGTEVFHLNDSLSRLYIRINRGEILYSRKNEGNVFSANIRIGCVFYESFDDKYPLDSSFVNVMDQKSTEEAENGSLITHIDFELRYSYKRLLELTLFDVNRNQEVVNYMEVAKSDKGTRQNFLVMDPEREVPLFRNYVHNSEKIAIQYNSWATAKLFVRHYKREYTTPPTPFSIYNSGSFSYKADSSYVMNLDENGRTTVLFDKKGFYHIQTDTTIKDGLTLFRHSDGFPEIGNFEEMIKPMRYLCTKQEFDAITAQSDQKISIDDFWLKCAGSHTRARKLIQVYYNRVKEANIYFSSYLEGWKTDRGLIYIIYGPPNVLYKTSNSESWVYGEENNMMSLNFTFVKVMNPFTENDYSLNRSSIYKNSWYRAVDIWRQGRIYSDQ